MANDISIIKQNYKAIANAIRGKTGSSESMTPSEMPTEIASIETGITPTGSLDITQNGDNIDVTTKATVNVNVPNPSTGTLDITINGQYDVTSKAGVNVNVPNPSTGTLNITENGDHNVTDYATAHVAVQQGITPTGTLEITENGDNIDVAQYAYVDVDVAGGIDAGPVPSYLTMEVVNYYMDTTSAQWLPQPGHSYRKAPFKGLRLIEIKAAAPDKVVLEPYYKVNDVIYPVIEIQHKQTDIYHLFDKRTGNTRELVCPKTMQYFNYSPSTIDGFESNKRLTNISVDSDNPFFISPDNCGCIISLFSPEGSPHSDPNYPYLIYSSEAGTIPTSVNQLTIYDYAFAYNQGVTSINIPVNVISVRKWAFKGCSNASQITIANRSGYIRLGTGAFADCGELNEPLSLTTWYVTFQDKDTEPDVKLFKGTYASSITFGNGLSQLNLGIMPSFNNSSFSVSSIQIANFKENTSDHDFDFSGIALSCLTKYQGAYYFGTAMNPYNILVSADWYQDGATCIDYSDSYTRKTLEYTTDFPIHPSCSIIANKAFYKCSDLISLDTDFFRKIRYVGRFAFQNCTNLISAISFEQSPSYTIINCGAFAGTGIPSVNLGENKVSKLEHSAFTSCFSLTSVTGTTMSYDNGLIDSGVFYTTPLSNINLNVMKPKTNGWYLGQFNGATLTSLNINWVEELDKQNLLYDSEAANSDIQLNCISQLVLKDTNVVVPSLWVTSNLNYMDVFITTRCKVNSLKVAQNNPFFSTDSSGLNLYNKDKTEILYMIADENTSELTVPNSVKIIGTKYYPWEDRGSKVKIYNKNYPLDKTEYIYYKGALSNIIPTTLNLPSGIEFIGYTTFEYSWGENLTEINIPYNQNNTYVTSDDGKALFGYKDLNGTEYEDLVLIWCNLGQIDSWPDFELNGSVINYDFPCSLSDAWIRYDTENFNLSTDDNFFWRVHDSSNLSSGATFYVTTLILGETVCDPYIDFDRFSWSGFGYAGTCDEFRQTSWYEMEYFEDEHIQCSDGVVHPAEDHSGSGSGSGDGSDY